MERVAGVPARMLATGARERVGDNERERDLDRDRDLSEKAWEWEKSPKTVRGESIQKTYLVWENRASAATLQAMRKSGTTFST